MRRKFSFSIDEYYHLYNRGTEKRIIFTEKNDYNRFVVLLHLCNSTAPIDISNILRGGLSFTELLNMDISQRLVDVGAYVLMPNHFHLLTKEKQENGISLFMKKLLTAYSMYFNKKYKRSGGLFQGPFQATHANVDEYLKYLFSYIHLNPVKLINPKWKENGIINMVKTKEYLDSYIYSSYLDYLGADRKEGKILNKQVFPEYFLEMNDFESCVDEWLSFNSLRTT